MNANYLGGRAGEVAGYAMPAHAALAGLPPTTIVNSEYEDLRASGERFAEQLAEAGVAVDVTVRRASRTATSTPLPTSCVEATTQWPCSPKP